MKLAVTGCNGNIGRHVVAAALKAGHAVHGIDTTQPSAELAAHANFTFSEVDLREYDKTVEAMRGSDAVIHLAAIPTPRDYVVDTHNTYATCSAEQCRWR